MTFITRLHRLAIISLNIMAYIFINAIWHDFNEKQTGNWIIWMAQLILVEMHCQHIRHH